jgi:hypothetical protein
LSKADDPIAPEAARKHVDWHTLVDYWLGDTDAPTTHAIDEHLLGCDACGAAFDQVVALSHGVREAFRRGAVATVLSGAFVDRLRAGGLRLREHSVPHNGSVVCGVGPDDDLLIGHMAAPLRGVQRLDAVFSYSFAPQREERLRDVPFDTASGEVLFAPQLTQVRQQPTHDLRVRLLAVDAGGEREIGHYLFRHQGGR